MLTIDERYQLICIEYPNEVKKLNRDIISNANLNNLEKYITYKKDSTNELEQQIFNLIKKYRMVLNEYFGIVFILNKELQEFEIGWQVKGE